MKIKWHGHSCFSIEGDDATLVIDPYEGLGTDLPAFKADIVIFSDELADKEGKRMEIEGAKVLDWPGEFEVSNVAIEGFSAKRHARNGDNEGENVNVFVFVLDGVKFCHLSGLSHELSVELLDRIGDVDVLMIPVGGGVVMDAKTAQSVVESVEPRMVMPMYYSEGKTKLDLKGAEDFMKAFGKTELEAVSSYKLTGKSALSDGAMEFVRFEA